MCFSFLRGISVKYIVWEYKESSWDTEEWPLQAIRREEWRFSFPSPIIDHHNRVITITLTAFAVDHCVLIDYEERLKDALQGSIALCASPPTPIPLVITEIDPVCTCLRVPLPFHLRESPTQFLARLICDHWLFVTVRRIGMKHCRSLLGWLSVAITVLFVLTGLGVNHHRHQPTVLSISSVLQPKD